MTPLPYPMATGLAVLVLLAALLDLRSRTIPNWLVLSGLATAVAGGLYFGRVVDALSGFGLALFVYAAFYLLRAMGGGDLKLMAVVGAFTGPSNWFVLFVLAAFFGGVAALIVLLATGGFVRALRNIGHILGSLLRGQAPHRTREELNVDSPRAVTLPHGVAIALGTLTFLWASA